MKLSIKLRFFPDKQQAQAIIEYLKKYQLVFNTASKRIAMLRAPWQYHKDNEITCAKCETRSEKYYQDKRTGENLCPKCYNAELGNQFIRKKILPSRNNTNVKKSVKRVSDLSEISIDYYSVVDHAINHFESFKEQRRQKGRALFRLKRRLSDLERILGGIESEQVITIPAKGRQRVPRYQLKDRFEAGFTKGYTKNSLETQVKSLNEEVSRREQLFLKGVSPRLEKMVAKLWEGHAVFDFSDGVEYAKLLLKLGGRVFGPFEIAAGSIRQTDSRGRVLEALTAIKNEYERNGKSKYAYVLVREPKGIRGDVPALFEFYLQYTFSPEVKAGYEPKTVLGIDLGIRHLMVYSLETVPPSHAKKPLLVKFEDAPLLLREKQRHRWYLRRLKPAFRGGKGIKRKSKRLSKTKSILGVENWVFHNISKKIVEFAKEKLALIAMENLEDIRRRVRYTGKKSRAVLSMFTQKKLRSLIKYKAEMAGVQFVEVQPAETSKRCYICGKQGERPFRGSSELFRCNNCGKTFNANYNASRNIAAKGYNLWKEKQNLKDVPGTPST
jgi:IS605 OrfB family transposase